MELAERRVNLHHGIVCRMRSLDEADAEELLHFRCRTAAETHFMLRRVEEITDTPERERQMLRLSQSMPDGFILGAFVETRLAGIGGLAPVGETERVRHRCSVDLCIRRPWWGIGMGKALLNELIVQAEKMGFMQMELAAASDNVRAIGLYRNMGFRQCGLIPDALYYRDGTFADEIDMVLRLKKE